MALSTLMEEAAEIERHLFYRRMTALAASQGGLNDRGRGRRHFSGPLCTVEGKPAFVVAFTSAVEFVLSASYFTVAVL